MGTINIAEKLSLFADHWNPRIIAELNGQHVKLGKFQGTFVWHKHDNEDELFFIVKGNLLIKLRDQDLNLQAGELVIIPKGVEHLPIAAEEVHIMLIEPKNTLNTGDVRCELTKEKLERI